MALIRAVGCLRKDMWPLVWRAIGTSNPFTIKDFPPRSIVLTRWEVSFSTESEEMFDVDLGFVYDPGIIRPVEMWTFAKHLTWVVE